MSAFLSVSKGIFSTKRQNIVGVGNVEAGMDALDINLARSDERAVPIVQGRERGREGWRV